jgi:hypothetical protein
MTYAILRQIGRGYPDDRTQPTSHSPRCLPLIFLVLSSGVLSTRALVTEFATHGDSLACLSPQPDSSPFSRSQV